MTGSAPKLFICYRREEAASHAGRLYDAIATRFGERNVFMDIELEPGIDFLDRVQEVVDGCHVFLVVVGPTWATLANGGGRPRIAEREDFVRLEVKTALRRPEVRVIPLLVGGARMPLSEELPQELRPLTRRNALELSDLRWRYDVGRLIGTLEELLETEETAAGGVGGETAAGAAGGEAAGVVGGETVGAGTVPPQPPEPHPTRGGPPSEPPRDREKQTSQRRWPVFVGLAALVGAVAAAVVLLAGGSGDDDGSAKEEAGQRVPATLSPVPTNRVVDGLGKATVRLNGNVATVSLRTNGLLNGRPHPMHIHAGEKGACPTVEAARNHNGHLSMSTSEGATFYGHPRVSLTTRGDIGVASILEFARYPSTGNFSYNRAIRLQPRTVRFIRRNLAVIVVHGIDYNGNGAYDRTLGGSDLNHWLSGEATAPALCGELVAGSQTAQPESDEYSASLSLPSGHARASAAAGGFFCDLRRFS